MPVKCNKTYRKKKKRKVFFTSAKQNLVIPFAILLANKFLNAIDFVDFIDRSVEWDSKHWKVSPGNLAKAAVLATFMKIRAPLYKIEEAFKGMDTEALFGKGVQPQHLNDDAIARALDRISQANLEHLFSSLCLALHSKFNIAFSRLHSDTTTVSFYGAYEPEDEMDEDTLKIVKGYNKDHLPECKQVVVGKIVNEHGIAVAGSTMDGNTSDIDWNQRALRLVKEIFRDRLHEVTYIADSKLINLPTFKQLADPQNRIKFISRCPANFYGKIANKVTKRAYQADQWSSAGQIGKGKTACTYEIQEFIENIDGYDTRFVVVRSSAGQERFDKAIKQEKAKLEKDLLALADKTFACEADAKKEWERNLKAYKKSPFKCHVDFKEIHTEKRHRGNPGKNPKPPIKDISWQISAGIAGENKAEFEKIRYEKECFVLITSVEKTEQNSIEILRQYKEQSVVEVQFRLLKEPSVASVVFLKTPERINALMMLLNISLLIRALIQYKIRKSINESTEELPRIGWDKKKLVNPTIKYVLETLEKAQLVRVDENSYSYGFTGEDEKLRVTTVLRLLGICIEDLLE